MKTTLSFSCFLFILFFTITIDLSTSVTHDCDKFLCDDLWNHIKAGEPYHFGPPTNGGGIILGSVGNDNPCPRFGLMLPSPDNIGDSFTFTPIVPNDAGLVPLGTPFAIASGEKPACDDTGILKMTHRDDKLQLWHVTADGEFNTPSSCFEFVKYPEPMALYTPTYLLQNCPYKCGEGSMKCYPVGNLSVSNGYNDDYFLTTEHHPYRYPMEFNLQSSHSVDDSASI